MEKDNKSNKCFIMRRIKELQKAGIPEKDVAEQLGFNTTIEMRKWKSGYFAGEHIMLKRWAKYLKKEGKTISEIAQITKANESVVKILLSEGVWDETAEEA